MQIVVTRSGALVKEVEVGDHDLRVGRNPDNDIVLEDQDKSVSRVHAEVRRQGESIVILDLNSQNGLWVHGQRVPMATFEPGVPIMVGPYALTLRTSAAPPPIPPAVSNETQRLEAVKNQTVAYVRPVAARPPEAAPAAATRRAAGPRVDPITRLARMPKPKLFALFGVVTLVAVGITAMLKPSDSTPAAVEAEATDENAETITLHLSAAKDLLAAGDPQAAIADHLDRILLIAPDHQEALDLKASAERLIESTDEVADAEPVTPADAGAAPEAVTAEPAPAAPPAAAPSPAPAAPASPAPAAGASRPAARRSAAAAPAIEDPPFPRRPGETQTTWRERGVDLQRRYRAAMALFNRGDYARAAEALQEIAADQPRYLDVDTRIAEAQRQLHASAMTAFRTGSDLEREGDLVKAMAEYDRALQIDPQLQEASTAKAALQTRLQGAAVDFYHRARQYDALGHRTEALDHYERALATLAEGDARRGAVQERVTLLRSLLKKTGADR